MKAFFSGEFNCLVATCIAEEGLDIGEVDLIVSFDALNSPVRMVQRMGRTGRKRAGKVSTSTLVLIIFHFYFLATSLPVSIGLYLLLLILPSSRVYCSSPICIF